MTTVDWRDIRAAFPTAGTTVYLNTGTVGLRPRPVVERLLAATERLESGGRDAYPEMVPEVDRARAKLAEFLGARPEEIALCGNATDAINWVVAGLDWSAGDEVLLSADEHPAMLWPWTYLQQRRGVRLRRFPVDADPERCLAAIRPLCGPRTRLDTADPAVLGGQFGIDHVPYRRPASGVVASWSGGAATAPHHPPGAGTSCPAHLHPLLQR